MKKQTLLIYYILFISFTFSQTKIGSNINGDIQNNFFGSSISLSTNGNFLAVVSSGQSSDGYQNGHVKVYQKANNNWQQIGSNINMVGLSDNYPNTIAINEDGSRVIIGAPEYSTNTESGLGLVKIFEYVNNSWQQIGNDFVGDTNNKWIGTSVSINDAGDVIAYGVPSYDFSKGYVKIFKNVNGSWVEEGNIIEGDIQNLSLGSVIELNSIGNRIAIKAFGTSQMSEFKTGHCRIYSLLNDKWILETKIDREASDNRTIWDIAMSDDGNVIAMGLPDYDFSRGRVKIFSKNNNTWIQRGNDILGENLFDLSGFKISLNYDGSIVAISAIDNSDNGNKSGHVRVFQFINNNWIKVGNDIDGDQAFKQSGSSISLSADGTTLAVGTKGYNVSSTISGHVRVYDLSAVLSTVEFGNSTFSIYPNPASNIITIKTEGFKDAIIYNNLGQSVLKSNLISTDVSNLTKGMYFITVNSEQGKSTKKLIIN